MALVTRLFTMVGLYTGMTIVFMGLQAGLLVGVSYLFKGKVCCVGPHVTRWMLVLSILMSIIWVLSITV